MRGLAVRRGGQMMPVKGVLTTCLMVVAAAVPEKIPIGAIFPPGTDDLQTALKYTFHIHNTNDTQARFKVEPVIDHVDSEDPFKIARTLAKSINSTSHIKTVTLLTIVCWLFFLINFIHR